MAERPAGSRDRAPLSNLMHVEVCVTRVRYIQRKLRRVTTADLWAEFFDAHEHHNLPFRSSRNEQVEAIKGDARNYWASFLSP